MRFKSFYTLVECNLLTLDRLKAGPSSAGVPNKEPGADCCTGL